MTATPLQQELPKEIYDGLIQMGYILGRVLGSGGFGSAYDCRWTNIQNNPEDIAVKHINFQMRHKYRPQYREQTPEERKEYLKKLLKEEKTFWGRIMLRIGPFETMTEKTPNVSVKAKGDLLRTEI